MTDAGRQTTATCPRCETVPRNGGEGCLYLNCPNNVEAHAWQESHWSDACRVCGGNLRVHEEGR